MPKFRVVEGTHQDENGRKYTKGQEVESPHDLVATFRGKFVQVGGQYRGPDRLAPVSPSPRSAPGFLDDPQQRQKSAEPVGQGGAPPDQLPPPTPTEQLGEGRGSEANPSGADAGPPYTNETNDEAGEPAGSDASGKPGEPEGTDVTDRFPKAAEQDFKVYKRTHFAAPDTGPFFVYDTDDLSKPVGGHGLKRTEVDTTVEKAIKAE